jgi:hypothetical protein
LGEAGLTGSEIDELFASGITFAPANG